MANIICEYKMDKERQAATAILSTKKDTWAHVEMIFEVGTEKNAKIIFEYLNEINVNMFSQKTGWNKVSDLADVPTSYKQGSLFLSVADVMSW